MVCEGGGEAYPQEGVQGSVLHEFREDHNRHTVGDHTLKADDVGMLELAHDGGLAQELTPLALRVSTLQSLDGDTALLFPWCLQPTPAHLTELTCTNYLFNLDIGDINLFGKFPHCLIRVFVSKRINVDLGTMPDEILPMLIRVLNFPPIALLPEAENCNDDDHQDQDHSHNRSACNQGQLLPPALALIQLSLTVMLLAEGTVASLGPCAYLDQIAGSPLQPPELSSVF